MFIWNRYVTWVKSYGKCRRSKIRYIVCVVKKYLLRRCIGFVCSRSATCRNRTVRPSDNLVHASSSKPMGYFRETSRVFVTKHLHCLVVHTLWIFRLFFSTSMAPFLLHKLVRASSPKTLLDLSLNSQDCLSPCLIVHTLLIVCLIYWHSYGPLMVYTWVK
jgi:hypothetical protein